MPADTSELARRWASVIPLELRDPYYYHLDTCFCPLAADVAIYYPPAFDEYGQRMLREMIGELITVSAEEAQALRLQCRGHRTNGDYEHRLSQTARAIGRAGFCPRETPLDEFVKAGGSAKCLTLRWMAKRPRPGVTSPMPSTLARDRAP